MPQNNVWSLPSQSQEGVSYTVMRLADGRLVCNCPAHTYQGKCKHTADNPSEQKEKPRPVGKKQEGLLSRNGRYQQTVIREDRETEFIDDVLEGKIRAGVARPTDEVASLADQPIVIESLIDENGELVEPEVEKVGQDDLMAKAVAAINAAQDHYLVWEGPWAVCQTCPFKHSVPLDFFKWDLIDGKPVKKKPIAK